MKNFSKFAKAAMATGLLFIIYGYVCRLAGLYFFWESRSIGWEVLLIGLSGLLYDRVRNKKKEGRSSVFEKTGIGGVAFILFVQTVLISVIPFSDAYEAAVSHVQADPELISEVGEIEGFGFIPTGGIEKTTSGGGTYGAATINLTVKGKREYRDITVYVAKYIDQPEWMVEGTE